MFRQDLFPAYEPLKKKALAYAWFFHGILEAHSQVDVTMAWLKKDGSRIFVGAIYTAFFLM
jgi:hypothetical protein